MIFRGVEDIEKARASVAYLIKTKRVQTIWEWNYLSKTNLTLEIILEENSTTTVNTFGADEDEEEIEKTDSTLNYEK